MKAILAQLAIWFLDKFGKRDVQACDCGHGNYIEKYGWWFVDKWITKEALDKHACNFKLPKFIINMIIKRNIKSGRVSFKRN